MFPTQKITPFLLFETQAEEAANFYVSVFKDSKILHILRNGENSAGPAGTVLTVTFQLKGQQFMALNGGPKVKFNESISMLVTCKDQEELDDVWDKLTADGGKAIQCSWLKDKYGLFWQIIPEALSEMMRDKNPKKTQAVLQAVWKMTKLDVKELREAYERA